MSKIQNRVRPQTAPEDDRLLKATEVAALLSVSTRLVWRFRAEGRLAAVQIAGATRFRLADVRRLMESGTSSPAR
jgi:predicted DNA-binding transcriptional regulator AlpA